MFVHEQQFDFGARPRFAGLSVSDIPEGCCAGWAFGNFLAASHEHQCYYTDIRHQRYWFTIMVFVTVQSKVKQIFSESYKNILQWFLSHGKELRDLFMKHTNFIEKLINILCSLCRGFHEKQTILICIWLSLLQVKSLDCQQVWIVDQQLTHP